MSEPQKTPSSRGFTLYINQMVQKFLDRLAKGRPATVVSLDPSGTIVTVNFEIAGVTLPQVQMPLAGPEYVRYPLQTGCKGVCLPADFYLGAMSGLGTGTADTTPRGNLSTLVFFPIGNKGFSATDDANAVVLYGPNGVVIRDTGNNCSIVLNTTDVIITGVNSSQLNSGLTGIDVVPSGITLEIGGGGGTTRIMMDATSITLTAGGVTAVLSAAGFVVSGAVDAPTVAATSSLKVGGVEMSGHTHDVVGVQTGAGTIVTGPPL